MHCIDPDGRPIGKVKLGCPVGNIEFGDRSRSRLFICASQALYLVFLNDRGARRP